MALRFNPPPNWPAPPEGFVPPAGWQPDPAWGPVPEGWQLWVDDASAASAPAVSASADPAWAPTQAVSTHSAPVADPTGQPVSAPSADYSAPSGFSGPSASGPAAPSGAGDVGQPGLTPPVTGGSAPVPSSAPTSSPYDTSMDYAQSPTPYQPGSPQAGQPGFGAQGAAPGFGAQPQDQGWQPLDVAGARASSSTPVFKTWWFWTIIVLVVLALVGGVILALSRNNDEPASAASPAAQASSAPSASATASASPGGCEQGSSQNCPGDLSSQTLTLQGSEYSDDPDSYVELSFGDVVWDGTDQVREGWRYGFEEPSEGYVYMRLPVTVTYHGEGQLNIYALEFKFVAEGNTFKTEYVYNANELRSQVAPYDGGSITGYVTFLIPSEYANSGAFAISFNYRDEYWMAEK